MTKEQRLERYKRAYDDIGNGRHSFICYAITVDCWCRPVEWYSNTFPEFWRFRPLENQPAHYPWCEKNHWHKEAIAERLTILAFCIAMCED